MLQRPAQTTDTFNNWKKQFEKNSSCIPYVSIHRSDNVLKVSKKKTANVSNNVFQVVFDSIQGIPIPSVVLQTASKNNVSIGCRLSVSLFDLESAAFFGKTWKSPAVIPVVSKREDDASEDESDSESRSESANLRANLIGNKLNLQLKQQCVYFHTHLQSRHIICVFEVSFEVQDPEPKEYSGGWSFMYPFNEQRGGIDPIELENNRQDDSKSAPFFQGTPRILPIISNTLFDSIAGYPGLHAITGTSLKYYFLNRPDVKSKIHFWRENCFIGANENIPGISRVGIRAIEPIPTKKILISKISVKIPPSVNEFESKLAESVRDIFFEENPELISIDTDGNLSTPIILERRLHIGFHNTLDFITPPNVINLQELNDDDDVGDGLYFSGNIKINDYFGVDPNIILLMMVEYKIQIKIKKMAEKKGDFAKLIEKLTSPSTSTSDELTHGIEKLVNVGWSHFQIQGSERSRGGPFEIQFNETTGVNPFSSYVYQAQSDIYMKMEEGEKRKVVPKHMPLSVTFSIQDNDRKSISDPQEDVHFKLPDVIAMKSPAFVQDLPEIKNVSLPKIANELPTQPEVIVKSSPVDYKETPEDDVEEQEEVQEIVPLKIEPDFVPLPAQVKSNSRSHLTRMEKARLLSAGFEVFNDQDGQKVNSVDPEENMNLKSDIGIEINDKKSNEFIFQIMGISLNECFKSRNAGRVPESVSFSFQFYNFPNIATDPYKVYLGQLPPNYQLQSSHQRMNSSPTHQRQWSEISKDSFKSENNQAQLWPGILYKLESDGRPAYDKSPGATLRFHIEPNSGNLSHNLRYGSTSLPLYLDQKKLYIDIWDGDSLLHIGTACLDLKSLLRQGKSAVAFDDDIDIMWTEYLDEENNHLRRSSSIGSQMSRITTPTLEPKSRNLKLGSLHVRAYNIGIKNLMGQEKQISRIGSDQTLIHDYHEQIRYRLPTESVSKKMIEVDSELKDTLQQRFMERVQLRQAKENKPITDKPQTEEVMLLQKAFRKMKEDHIDVPQEWVAGEEVDQDSYLYRRSRKERKSDLETVEVFRERHKRSAIQNKIREQMTSKFVMDISFGQGYFFEFSFTNPYNMDHNFEIFWEDMDLRIISSENEWLYHRRKNKMFDKVESNLTTPIVEGRSQIFMSANETVHIPFLYQNFEDYFAVKSVEKSGHIQNSNLPLKTIHVAFLNSKKMASAFLDLVVNPMNFYVDRSLQLFNYENELVRKNIRYVPQASHSLSATDKIGNFQFESVTNDKFLKCSNPDVVAAINSSKDSKYKEISFKYRVGAAPEHNNIYFVFYNDQYCTSVHEIWRVCIHTLFRLDVNCIYGQLNSSSLVLRGGSTSRQVACYTNLSSSVAAPHSGPFTISANSLSEIPLLLKVAESDSQVIANVVDIETKTLLSSWLIVPHISMPSITKVFEIKLPRGRMCNKKLSYTNPFLHSKILTLRTDCPHLMQFKNTVMELKGGETQYIGLRFLPNETIDAADILVFLNNDKDKVEECLSIHITFN